MNKKGKHMNNEDIKHLDLLAMFHYIVGGIIVLFSCMPFMHVFIGLAIISGKLIKEGNGSNPPAFIGWMFIIIGTLFILIGWSIAICIIITGRKLKTRKNRIFCMAIAGIECMFMPFGTVLGVFTLIVLNKASIKEIFAQHINSFRLYNDEI
jgi:hypothetical protein